MSSYSSRTDPTAGFVARYDIKVLDTNKQCVNRNTTRSPYLTPPWEHTSQHEFASQYMDFYREPLITLSIPQSKLEALIRIEEIFYGNIEDVGHRHIFEKWWLQEEEERQLRKKYAAAAQAYEEYRLTLKMLGQNPKKISPDPY